MKKQIRRSIGLLIIAMGLLSLPPNIEAQEVMIPSGAFIIDSTLLDYGEHTSTVTATAADQSVTSSTITLIIENNGQRPGTTLSTPLNAGDSWIFKELIDMEPLDLLVTLSNTFSGPDSYLEIQLRWGALLLGKPITLKTGDTVDLKAHTDPLASGTLKVEGVSPFGGWVLTYTE